MKQVELNDAIRSKLKSAAGDNVDLNNLAVFRATAINTLPVRKRHPVYNGGVHTRSFLEQMLTALNAESLPLQIMHNGQNLPIGRIFDGEVLDFAGRSELQVLFWIDKTADGGTDKVNLVNNGTVDQVSVAVLAKSAISNKSGFDFLGPDATFENIYEGTDHDGNVMGKDGAHVLMSALDTWFEMSLVGQGGIQGAKIHASGDMKLAASGVDAPRMTLLLSTDNKDDAEMDLLPLVAELSTAKADVIVANAKLATLEAALAASTARVATLEAEVVTLTPAATALTASQADATALKAGLVALFGHTAAMSGNVTATAPEGTDEIVAGVKGHIEKLKLSAGGTPTLALTADAGHGERTIVRGNEAFRRRAL